MGRVESPKVPLIKFIKVIKVELENIPAFTLLEGILEVSKIRESYYPNFCSLSPYHHARMPPPPPPPWNSPAPLTSRLRGSPTQQQHQQLQKQQRQKTRLCIYTYDAVAKPLKYSFCYF